MLKKKILLTGATGYLASKLIPVFQDKYDLFLIDINDTNSQVNKIREITNVDLINGSDNQLRNMFNKVDYIIHLGHNKYSGKDIKSQYEGEKKNIDMMQKIYQLSLDCGVKRVISASSVQASKWYDQLFYSKQKEHLDPYEYPKPENFYGWAKAAYESLGFLYANGSLGRKLEIIQLRIVAPRLIDATKFDKDTKKQYLRDITGFISDRDFVQLLSKSIDTENINDEFDVPFHIFYGTSNNSRTFWSITNARNIINYNPIDDSEILFSDDINRILK